MCYVRLVLSLLKGVRDLNAWARLRGCTGFMPSAWPSPSFTCSWRLGFAPMPPFVRTPSVYDPDSIIELLSGSYSKSWRNPVWGLTGSGGPF